MKRAAPGASGVASRVASVKKAISKSSECPDRVKQMLSNTLPFTVGTPVADRHPFNERFVAMISQVMETEHSGLTQSIASKEAAFAELSPQKATREATLEEKKGVTAEKSGALSQAKEAVAGIAVTVKDAAAKLSEAKKAQQAGDAEMEGIIAKRGKLLDTRDNSLAPLIDGSSADEDAKSVQLKDVLSVGKLFDLDASLMSTAAEVLKRSASERGGFDATCIEQLKAAVASATSKLDEEIASFQPASAERAAVVKAAEDAKTAAEAEQEDLKAKLQAAKEAKAAADADQKAAAKSLHDFMPELKASGDSLDAAKRSLKEFIEGAQTALTELKDFKEGDFVKKSYYQQIDGLRCDRAIIDACREAVAPEGQTPGRVSLDDAKRVFVTIADGNKETRAERWTLRHCLQEFKWSEAAHDWIVEELKKVPQEDAPAKKARTSGKGYYQTIDGYKCDRAIVDICQAASIVEGEVPTVRRLSLEDAQKVWAKAADGKKVTHAEKWTVKYCLSSFTWSRDGHDYVLEQLAGLSK